MRKHDLSAAAVAQKAGKSEGYVKDRIDLAEGAGEKAREAYIKGTLGLVALQAVAVLPCQDTSTYTVPSVQASQRRGERRVCGGQAQGSGRGPVCTELLGRPGRMPTELLIRMYIYNYLT